MLTAATANLPSLVDIQTERARRSLSYYARAAWHVVEPGTNYVHNWHIDVISDYLMAVTAGEIRNLIINIPPRHMKSLLVCVLWPTWVWTHSPSKRWLFASYADTLAVRDAVKSRRIIASPWYQRRWGHVFRMAGDQNVKSRYENDKSGHRISLGVGGGATGEGGDIIVVDDPHKALEAESDTIRQGVLTWWDETMSTRGDDPRKVSKVVIMQRLHEDDLTGHLIEKMREPGAEQYEHLCLPAEYEPNRFYSSIGLKDARSAPGELLWPERFGEDELTKLKVSLGKRGAAGQLQQSPAPAGGAIFERNWWTSVAAPTQPFSGTRYNHDERAWYYRSVGRYLSWDTALKDSEQNDYCALSVFELQPEYVILVRHVWKKKLQFPQLALAIEQEAERWNYDGKLRGIIIEDKGSGTSSLQSLRQGAPQAIADLLIAFNPQGSKELRARQASLWCERGCVYLPQPGASAEWLLDFEENLFKFPAIRHDDDVDTLTQGIIYLENLLAEGWKLRNNL